MEILGFNYTKSPALARLIEEDTPSKNYWVSCRAFKGADGSITVHAIWDGEDFFGADYIIRPNGEAIRI